MTDPNEVERTIKNAPTRIAPPTVETTDPILLWLETGDWGLGTY